jgi:hypothetical protein
MVGYKVTRWAPSAQPSATRRCIRCKIAWIPYSIPQQRSIFSATTKHDSVLFLVVLLVDRMLAVHCVYHRLWKGGAWCRTALQAPARNHLHSPTERRLSCQRHLTNWQHGVVICTHLSAVDGCTASGRRRREQHTAPEELFRASNTTDVALLLLHHHARNCQCSEDCQHLSTDSLQLILVLTPRRAGFVVCG